MLHIPYLREHKNEIIKTITKEIYDASEVIADNKIRSQLKQFEKKYSPNYLKTK